MKRSFQTAIVLALALTIFHAKSFADNAAASAKNWPQWRGHDFTGAALESETPATWKDGENIRWKVPIPGKGHATPIIWENKVFILTAIPPESRRGGQRASLRRYLHRSRDGQDVLAENRAPRQTA
jgi:hypothetical protein